MKIFAILLTVLITCSKGFAQNENAYKIIITKSKYIMEVYDNQGWLATYPCVFGNKDLKEKIQQGDRETPEGEYRITRKRKNKKWACMINIDYPNHQDSIKFEERIANGLLPKNAKIGDGIAIHGTWPHEDYNIDMYQNWTDGCISLKNADAMDLFSYIPIGTTVIIRH